MLKIGDVSIATGVGGEFRYYFTEESLANEIVIIEATEERDGEYFTELTLYHRTEEDAAYYGLDCEGIFNIFLRFNVANTVFELFRKRSSLDDFFKFIEEVSSEHMSVGTQNEEKSKKEFREFIDDVFDIFHGEINLK